MLAHLRKESKLHKLNTNFLIKPLSIEVGKRPKKGGLTRNDGHSQTQAAPSFLQKSASKKCLIAKISSLASLKKQPVSVEKGPRLFSASKKAVLNAGGLKNNFEEYSEASDLRGHVKGAARFGDNARQPNTVMNSLVQKVLSNRPTKSNSLSKNKIFKGISCAKNL